MAVQDFGAGVGPHRAGRALARRAAGLQVAVLALMVAIGRLNGLNWEFYWSVLVAGLLFAYQQKLIAKRERDACFKAFMNNNYVGLVLFLGLAMSYFL